MYFKIKLNATILSVTDHPLFPRKSWEKEVQTLTYQGSHSQLLLLKSLSKVTDRLNSTHSGSEQLSQMCGLTRHLQMKWQLSKSSEETIIQFFMD